VTSIYALERSEELRPIRPSKVNARVWRLGQSRDKPYGREKARIRSGLPCSLLFIPLQLSGFSKTSYVQYCFPAFAVGGEGNGKKRDEV
jgi:hypothetical protein